MKTFSSYLCLIAMIALVFMSCSKDEPTVSEDSSDKASLSFGALVNDLASKAGNKQTTTAELPQCSNDEPAYVEIVLSQGGNEVVGTSNEPLRVDFVAGEVFTEEVSELELTPGTYSLDYFQVYNASGTLIWLAPRGGVLADFIDNPLPLSINLGAGVKKYVEVSVLCYDDRNLNEYGYQFFDIDTNEAMEFCIFGNYCPPSGRHYPASFSVDVWMWEDGAKGTQIHSDVTNTVALNDAGDYAATPVCIPLPDREGEDEFYVEITLLNSDAYSADIVAGDIGKVIKTGVLTEAEVKGLFEGENNLDYSHFRYGEGCTLGDMPPIFNEPGSDAQFYKACLDPMNDSEAGVFAYFKLDGNMLQTTVLAANVEPNQRHAQHIHGKVGENATCPPDSAAGEDGLISLEEGLPFYGGPLLSLTDEEGEFPMANAGGNYIYERTFNLGTGGLISAANLGPLEDRAVVLHGMNVDGGFEGTLPVACQEIEKQE